MKTLLTLAFLIFAGYKVYERFVINDPATLAYRTFATHIAHKQYKEAREIATGEAQKNIDKLLHVPTKNLHGEATVKIFRTNTSSESNGTKNAPIGNVSKVEQIIESKIKSEDSVTILARQNVYHKYSNGADAGVSSYRHTAVVVENNKVYNVISFTEDRIK